MRLNHNAQTASLERAQSERQKRDCGKNAAPRGQPQEGIDRLSDVFEDLCL